MSKLYAESVDSSSYTVSTLLTSAAFTSLPLYVPWPQPKPNRNYRISYSGNSTSFVGKIVIYWRPESAIVSISNYTGPSNLFSGGSTFNFNNTGFSKPLGFPPFEPIQYVAGIDAINTFHA